MPRLPTARTGSTGWPWPSFPALPVPAPHRRSSSPEALRGSLGFYRAFDATLAQNAQRKATPLTMPVLAIGGASSYGDHVAEAMRPIAENVQSVVIAGAGHWVAEEAPDEMLAALTEFLARTAKRRSRRTTATVR